MPIRQSSYIPRQTPIENHFGSFNNGGKFSFHFFFFNLTNDKNKRNTLLLLEFELISAKNTSRDNSFSESLDVINRLTRQFSNLINDKEWRKTEGTRGVNWQLHWNSQFIIQFKKRVTSIFLTHGDCMSLNWKELNSFYPSN